MALPIFFFFLIFTTIGSLHLSVQMIALQSFVNFANYTSFLSYPVTSDHFGMFLTTRILCNKQQ